MFFSKKMFMYVYKGIIWTTDNFVGNTLYNVSANQNSSTFPNRGSGTFKLYSRIAIETVKNRWENPTFTVYFTDGTSQQIWTTSTIGESNATIVGDGYNRYYDLNVSFTTSKIPSYIKFTGTSRSTSSSWQYCWVEKTYLEKTA